MPTQRIILRSLTSDSKKQLPEDGQNNNQTSAKDSSEASTQSTSGEAISETTTTPSASKESLVFQELVDTVDTRIQIVRGKVSPKDLLYYFALLATFGILVVGPLVARNMQRSDTDYDELDSEDPIADLATFVRTEFLQESGEQGSRGSTRGGLDVLIADLLRSPQIQNAINDLVNKILTSPQFKRSCSILLKELWKDLVEDPETLKQIIHLLYNAIQDDAIKDAAVQLVTEVFADKEVLDEVVELFQRLGKEPKVQLATQDLLVESAHNALNDPEILDHSMEFATDVVGDDVVQQTAGEALYNTLSYAVRPTLSVFLAVLGAGLIFVSLMAFQHSISPESQSESLDKALNSFETSNLIQGIIKLVTFPWHVLVACKEALKWVLLLPIRLISGTLDGLGKAGNVTVDILNRCIRWLLNLPFHLAQSVLGGIGNGLTTLSNTLVNQSRHLSKALAGSILGTFFHHVANTLLATTGGIHVAWITLNETVANGALFVEELGREVLQNIDAAMTYAVSSFLVAKSAMHSVSQAILTGWTSTNRVVADTACAIERLIRGSWSATTKLSMRLGMRMTELGLTKDSLQVYANHSKQKLLGAYSGLDQAAEKLGFLLEDIVNNLISNIRGYRWSRPSI